MPPRRLHQPVRKHSDGRNNTEYQIYKRKRRTRWLNWYKEKKGCELCGYSRNGVALDFDHLDPLSKRFNVSSRSMTYSLKEIFIEIRKCRVLCANCHRIHSYESKHFNNSHITGHGGSCGV